MLMLGLVLAPIVSHHSRKVWQSRTNRQNAGNHWLSIRWVTSRKRLFKAASHVNCLSSVSLSLPDILPTMAVQAEVMGLVWTPCLLGWIRAADLNGANCLDYCQLSFSPTAIRREGSFFSVSPCHLKDVTVRNTTRLCSRPPPCHTRTLAPSWQPMWRFIFYFLGVADKACRFNNNYQWS